MTAETSSLLRPDSHPTSTLGEWGGYASYLKRPYLVEEPRGFSLAGIVSVLRLFALDLLIMAILVGIATAATAMGIEFPDNALEGLTFTPDVIFLVVIAVPIYEEIVFRGWLTGKLAHVAGVLGVVAVMAGLVLSGMLEFSLAWLAAGAAFLVLVAVLRQTRGYAPVFPLFFLVSSLGFALVHLVNYEEGSILLLLPLVIPQLVAGTLFGYVRMAHGLWASVLFHILHNAAFLSGAILTGQVPTGG